MSELPSSITAGEPLARRMLLVQAIETSDTQGKLLSPAERENIDRLALQSARKGAPAHAATAPTAVMVESFLRERAGHVLRVVENRNPALASLQQPWPWTQWVAMAAFMAAVIFGAASDRIANPHRVDLLSLPLLALLAWNLAIYGALIASYFLHRRRHERPASDAGSSSFMRWADGLRNWHRRSGQLRVKVTAVFMRHWHGATAALQAQRWRKVLHLAAAGWALGIALSLFSRGLVVEYRVGWESTFLNAEQVYAILRVLLLPATALFPFQPFTPEDIASLQFSNSSGAMAGARWVYLYATLLAVVVILPRLGLALYAGWRERMLARRVMVNLTAPYYKRLLAMLNPTRIQLGLLALRDEDRAALLRVIRPRPQTLHAGEGAHGLWQTLIRTSTGEELFVAHIPVRTPEQPQPPPQAIHQPSSWTNRTFGRLLGTRPASAAPETNSPPHQATHDDSDAVLLVVQGADDIESALPSLPETGHETGHSGQPTLLLVNALAAKKTERAAATSLCRTKARALGLYAEVISFDSFARSWVQDSLLLDAIARCLPSPKKEGFARLADAWIKRNQALFAHSMQLIATQLLDAARVVEEVRSAPPSVKRLISTSDRQSDAQARKDAMAAVVERLQRSMRHTHAQLLHLHGIEDAKGEMLEPPLQAKFDIQAPINAREAGLAGAATGAASGASIDLVTGGLTLGAAAALGALIGGGAALAGAAWKNRATPAGTTLVQLSDDMLRAMAQAALLRYLALAHFDRIANGGESSETAALWESSVVAALEANKDSFLRCWAEARMQPVQPQMTGVLGDALQKTMRSVLDGLYPGGGS